MDFFPIPGKTIKNKILYGVIVTEVLDNAQFFLFFFLWDNACDGTGGFLFYPFFFFVTTGWVIGDG